MYSAFSVEMLFICTAAELLIEQANLAPVLTTCILLNASRCQYYGSSVSGCYNDATLKSTRMHVGEAKLACTEIQS